MRRRNLATLFDSKNLDGSLDIAKIKTLAVGGENKTRETGQCGGIRLQIVRRRIRSTQDLCLIWDINSLQDLTRSGVHDHQLARLARCHRNPSIRGQRDHLWSHSREFDQLAIRGQSLIDRRHHRPGWTSLHHLLVSDGQKWIRRRRSLRSILR